MVLDGVDGVADDGEDDEEDDDYDRYDQVAGYHLEVCVEFDGVWRVVGVGGSGRWRQTVSRTLSGCLTEGVWEEGRC